MGSQPKKETEVENSTETVEEYIPERRPLKESSVIMGLIGVGITGIIIHLFTHVHFQATALFYIGLPLILAYLFIISNPSRSATGAILKGISIVLLLSGPILQEGFICIVMAAPLFYIIGGAVGLMVDYSRKKKLSKLEASPMILLMALLSLEGTHPYLTAERNDTVRVEQIVKASEARVQQQLEQPLSLGKDVPSFLKIFPFPTSKQQMGNELGDQNTLNFVYYKHFYFNAKIGDLTYKITSKGSNHIESTIVSDDSYVSTYLDWKTSKVSWKVMDDQHTKVIWEISYKRKLDPSWYFGTLEHYTVTLMANALIKYAATPELTRG